MKKYKIAILPGDGIGPEVVGAAVKVLDEATKLYGFHLDYREVIVGGIALESTGTPLPDLTVESCRQADAVLMGPVGGSQWDNHPRTKRPEYSLIALRKALGLYIHIRPCIVDPSLVSLSPLRSEITAKGVDFILVRELTGIASLRKNRNKADFSSKEPTAYDVLLHSEDQIRKIARSAFYLARSRKKHLTSVDKANVLESSRAWRDVMLEEAKHFPDIKLDFMYMDAAVNRMIFHPDSFDVIVTDNLFGDFLSEESGALLGSPALACAAALGDPRTTGLFSGIHGTAQNLVGKDECNPLAMIFSSALMMRLGLNEPLVALTIENAVTETLRQGYRTKDLLIGDEDGHYQVVGTKGMVEAVLKNLRRL